MEYSTNQFSFQKKGRVLVAELSELGIPPGAGFPNSFDIRSAHTGKVVRFVKNQEAAMRNEGWDGEQYEYFTLDCDIAAVLIND